LPENLPETASATILAADPAPAPVSDGSAAAVPAAPAADGPRPKAATKTTLQERADAPAPVTATPLPPAPLPAPAAPALAAASANGQAAPLADTADTADTGIARANGERAKSHGMDLTHDAPARPAKQAGRAETEPRASGPAHQRPDADTAAKNASASNGPTKSAATATAAAVTATAMASANKPLPSAGSTPSVALPTGFGIAKAFGAEDAGTEPPVNGVATAISKMAGDSPAQQAFSHILARAGAGHPSLTQQVAAEISHHAKAGASRFTIRLDPPELGRIDIRLTMGEDKAVHALLTADNETALELLQRDVRLLERALHEAGVRTDAGSLNFSLRQGQDGHAQRSGQNVPEGTGNGHPAKAEDTADAENRSTVPWRGTVNVRPLDLTI